jgi:hypothetical protein
VAWPHLPFVWMPPAPGGTVIWQAAGLLCRWGALVCLCVASWGLSNDARGSGRHVGCVGLTCFGAAAACAALLPACRRTRAVLYLFHEKECSRKLQLWKQTPCGQGPGYVLRRRRWP